MSKYQFTCEACRKAPFDKYPRNWRWKTERGFKNHNCYSARLAREAKAKADLEEKASLWQQWLDLDLLSKRPGDKVYYVSYRVVAPTHVPKGYGRRMVKVRYEEKRRYFATSGAVDEIVPPNGLSMLRLGDMRDAVAHSKILPYGYRVGAELVTTTFRDHDVADQRAADNQKGHEEHLRESELCR